MGVLNGLPLPSPWQRCIALCPISNPTPLVGASWLDPSAHSHPSLHYPKGCAAGAGHSRRQLPFTQHTAGEHVNPRKAIWSVFSKACCGRMRGNGLELNQDQHRLDVRKKIFTMRVVKHWDGLPRKVVDALSLETCKVRLHGALSNLI